MQHVASSLNRLKLYDVVKAVKLSSSISKGVDGNFKRIYKLKLELEDAK
jgi:hypothetical protein